ncbi:MAG: hypothetical protein SGARI_006841 [Bacillariaceae sp.]
MDEQQKRLVLLAKHPHANERSVAQVLQKQKRQQEAAAAAAKRKGTQFRQQQKQHEEMEQQRVSKFKQQQQQKMEPRYSNRTVLTETSSSDEEEMDEESLQIVYQSPRAAAQANKNAAAAVVWQAAGQGSGEGSFQPPSTQSSRSSPQRISFSARELPPPEGLEEQPVYSDKKSGIVSFAVAVFSKMFPNDPAQTSSGASILSESLDGRSVNTANKSLASKATCSSAQTRKMNNLSGKSLQARDNKMNSIHEDDDRNDRGIFRFVSTRNGLIICVLILR